MGQELIRAEGAWARAQSAPLFAHWMEMMIVSALEGSMGNVWTLEDAPGGALVECADFLFLSSRSTRSAESLLRAWKQERAGRYAILVARPRALGAGARRLWRRRVAYAAIRLS